jgi:hypothetical protein
VGAADGTVNPAVAATWDWSIHQIINSGDSNWSMIETVVFGNGKFIAAGGQGKASVSADNGATWTLVTNTGFNAGDTITAALSMDDGRIILAGSGKMAVITP